MATMFKALIRIQEKLACPHQGYLLFVHYRFGKLERYVSLLWSAVSLPSAELPKNRLNSLKNGQTYVRMFVVPTAFYILF